MNEEMLKYAESMRDTILHCKRHGATHEYYVERMMHYAQAAIDRKLNRPRTLQKDWVK